MVLVWFLNLTSVLNQSIVGFASPNLSSNEPILFKSPMTMNGKSRDEQ